MIALDTAKWLLRNTTAIVVVCSRGVNENRTERVFYDVDRSRVKAIAADVCQQSQLEEILKGEQITHVAHLAALQTPDCNAHRDIGLQIAASDLGIASHFKITIGQGEAPFISELDYEPFLKAFPDVPNTPLDKAVRDSLAVFMDQAKRGWLTQRDIK